MKSTLIGIAAGTALIVSAGSALAGGSLKDAGGPIECCQTNWNGLYIGGAVGYGVAATELDLRLTDTYWNESMSLFNLDGISSRGFQGTVTVGYDRQLHPGLVLGVFGDYTFGDLETSASIGGGYVRLNADISNAWAVGARLGFVRSCCTMWYVNAGYSQADFDWSASVYDYSIGNGGKTLSGWFVGGGVEQQIHSNLFLKLEYRYTSYDTARLFSYWVDEYERIDLNSSTDVHSVRLGVNWKFDLFHDRPSAPAPLK